MFGRVLENFRRWWDRNQPAFWRRLSPGYRAALVILILAVVWIGSGVLGGHKSATSAATARPADTIRRVQVMRVLAAGRDASLTIRGRTQAVHSVDVRAQVDGVVRAIRFE